ncbi:MAG: DUF2459 domain-containing protein [Planctomycetota bacterium]|nr:DUF2459 domain-containing protein [Planctomycetota bacterium]
MLLGIGAAGLAAWIVGCTATVKEPAAVADPVSVLLLREALHTGLVFPRETELVEFGFGDWAWYALEEDEWYDALPTVLWPTRATLSRRVIPATDAESARAALPWLDFVELRVERSAAERLRDRLEEQFAAGSGELVQPPGRSMQFVPCEGSYWFGHNCADVAAQWLEELGCEVSWLPIRFDLERAP